MKKIISMTEGHINWITKDSAKDKAKTRGKYSVLYTYSAWVKVIVIVMDHQASWVVGRLNGHLLTVTVTKT